MTTTVVAEKQCAADYIRTLDNKGNANTLSKAITAIMYNIISDSTLVIRSYVYHKRECDQCYYKRLRVQPEVQCNNNDIIQVLVI